MTLSEQRKELGQGKEGVEGGMGLRGRADLLRQEIKNELRQLALSASDWKQRPLEQRGGIEEEDLRRDFTKDQNLEGEE